MYAFIHTLASTCPARESPSQSACWQDGQWNQLQQDYDALRTELYKQAAALVSEKAASAEAAAVLAEKVPFQQFRPNQVVVV